MQRKHMGWYMKDTTGSGDSMRGWKQASDEDK